MGSEMCIRDRFCDASVGAGREPTKGTLIKAHYTGRLADGTGRVFDSSYTRGSPLQFKIGAGQVIRGWDEGILGGDGVPPMKVGGKRVLVIPAKVRSVHWSPYDRVRVVNADPEGLFPASLSAQGPSLSIPALDAFQLHH